MKNVLTTLFVLSLSIANAQSYITHRADASGGLSIWDADDIEFDGILISIQGYCENGTEGMYISIRTNNGLEYDDQSTAVVTTRSNLEIAHINGKLLASLGGPWFEYKFLLSDRNSNVNWKLDEFIEHGFKSIKMSNGNASKTYTVDAQTSTKIVTYLSKVRTLVEDCYD